MRSISADKQKRRVLVDVDVTNRTAAVRNSVDWQIECADSDERGFTVLGDGTFRSERNFTARSTRKGVVVIDRPPGKCVQPVVAIYATVTYDGDPSGLRYRLPQDVANALKLV